MNSTVSNAEYLRLISEGETLTLDAGEDSLIWDATETFDGWIEPSFKNRGCNVESGATEATNVQVHEMTKDGTFEQIYGGLGDSLNVLCLTQGQIVGFVKRYRNWLRTDGYGTLFLFKVGEEFFVADVCVNSGRLYIRAYQFSLDYVWDTDHCRRFVLPQLF